MSNESNPLEEAMRPQPEPISKTERKVTSTGAESLVGTVATLYKILWIVLSILSIALLIWLSGRDQLGNFWLALIIVLPLVFIIVLPLMSSWAKLKLTVNMSRNLFVIKDAMLSMAYSNRLKSHKTEGGEVSIEDLKELHTSGQLSDEEFIGQISAMME